MNKEQLLSISIDIIKEYSRGGGEHPAAHLKDTYEMLKDLNSDATN